VGWRDRDYGKFTQEEWSGFTGPGASRSSGARRGGFSGKQVGASTLLAALVSLGAFLVIHQRVGGLSLSSPGSPHAAAATRTVADPNMIRIRWRPHDLKYAERPGRICLADAAHGRICAAYLSGGVPADILTRKIRSMGLSVESTFPRQ
jgi:hypothetical protein